MKSPKPPSPQEPTNSAGELGQSIVHSQVASRSMPIADLRSEIGDIEFDPDDVLASLTPFDTVSTDDTVVPTPIVFDNEQPARVHLELLDYRERLTNIVKHLKRAIVDDSSAQRKLEYALVASEILAFTGDLPHSQELANQAVNAQPTSRLARYQARHLALEAGDLDTVQHLAQTEGNVLTDPLSQTQWYLWYSDYLRLIANDFVAATRALATAAQNSATHPQLTLLQLIDTLATTGHVDLESIGTSPYLADALSGIELLARLRGQAQLSEPAEPSPTVMLMMAAAAVNTGDVTGAAQQLVHLTSIEDSKDALCWLRAALWLANADTRQTALNELLDLQSRSPCAEAHAALLECSVEVRDLDTTRRLLLSDTAVPDDPAAAADELILATYATLDPEYVRQRCERLTLDINYLPLALAAKSLLGEKASTWLEVDSQTHAQLAWAEWLTVSGRPDAATPPTHAEPDEVTDDTLALSRVFAIEAASVRLDWHTVATLTLEAGDESGAWAPGDRQTIAGLFFAAAKNADEACAAWLETLSACPLREAALRASLETLPAEDKCAKLESIATQVDVQDERAVWLLLEAALTNAQIDYNQAERLLQHAHALEPTLIAPVVLGEDLARKHAQAEVALQWVGKRAEYAEEAAESALTAVQEALLHWHHNESELEASLLRALENVTDDITLGALLEHLAPAAALGTAHEEALPVPSGTTSIDSLCAVAARSAWLNNWPIAHEATISLSDLDANTVGTLWADQAILSGQPYPKLFEKLFSQARTETDPVAQRELYERLARLDSSAGSEGNFELWQNAIIERTADYLPALRVIERSVMRRRDWHELAIIAQKLMQKLDHDEALSYCWLAATVHTHTGDWVASAPFVEWAAHQESPPLWALHRFYAHAKANGNWKSMYDLECRLAQRSAYVADATALLLRSAQSAQHLGQPSTAIRQIKEALEISPEYAVIPAMAACHYFDQGDLTATAESCEHLAQICADQDHRKTALELASEIWLQLKDEARAEFSLEQLLAADPLNAFAITHLTQLYRASQAHDRLAALLERQIEHVDDPSQRALLQVERARCLLTLGLTIAADKALAPVLSVFPDSVDALEVKAQIAFALDDVADAQGIYTHLLTVNDRSGTTNRCLPQAWRDLRETA